MKVVQQDASILIPETPMKHIEKIGRICYKSEDKIIEGSDRKFVSILFKNNHHAMIEHFRFIMEVNQDVYYHLLRVAPKHMEFTRDNDRCVISCNARALLELHKRCVASDVMRYAIQSICDDLIAHIVKEYDCHELFGLDRNNYCHMFSSISVTFIENSREYMSENEWNRHGWMSVRMVTDRGITHEVVRHREETSFAQESTRYCNYSQDKFGKEISVVDQGFIGDIREMWTSAMEECEYQYFKLLDEGITPQMARSVLPTCLKTELVMTAPMYEWGHYFNLRLTGTTGKPHPMIKHLSSIIYDKMNKVYYGGNEDESTEDESDND